MKNYFLFYFFTIFMIDFHPTLGMEQQCTAVTCNRYTQSQVVRQLRNIATDITPLGIKLANLLSDMSRNLTEPNHKLNTIFVQSLWSMSIYSNFPPGNMSASCVFERILYLTILDDEFENKEYNQALKNYEALVGAAINFSIRSSLARFSCPTSIPPVTESRPQECINGSIVNKFLKEYGSTLPPYLASLIQSLNRSQNIKDRTVAIILCAFSTEPLNGLFQCILETPELLKAIQLKACDVPITPCCCKSREEDLISRNNAVSSVITGLVERLMKK